MGQPNTPSPQSASNKRFCWSKLSGEIKNLIYNHALKADVTLRISMIPQREGGPRLYIDNDDPNHLVPNLLLLNKQTYNEAVPILYGENHFRFTWDKALLAWLAQLERQPDLGFLERLALNQQPANPAVLDNAYGPLTWVRNITFQPWCAAWPTQFRALHRAMAKATRLESFVVELKKYLEPATAAERLHSVDTAQKWLRELGSTAEARNAAIDSIFTLPFDKQALGSVVPWESLWGMHFVDFVQQVPERDRAEFRERLKALVASDVATLGLMGT